MTDDECRKLGIMTAQELKEMDQRLEKVEETGIADTQKYFDRLHDKIFSLNNLLIAAYLGLIAFKKDVPNWIFVLPTINSLLLLYIDYRMMLRARLQANITNVNEQDRIRYGTLQTCTNLCSLISIWATIFIILVFGYYLLSGR